MGILETIGSWILTWATVLIWIIIFIIVLGFIIYGLVRLKNRNKKSQK